MTPSLPYENRVEAARALADELGAYRDRNDVLVLALPRGGVPVGYEIAEALKARLDILLVRKLGLPGQRELAMGAIASGGVVLRNSRVLDMSGVSDEAFDSVERQEREELRRRESAYRGDRSEVEVEGKCVILVDDGLATGSTMRAAIRAVRQHDPAKVVVAVPVAPQETIERLREEADEVVCPAVPKEFYGIGQFYEDFSQLDDEQVRDWLHKAWNRQGTEVIR